MINDQMNTVSEILNMYIEYFNPIRVALTPQVIRNLIKDYAAKNGIEIHDLEIKKSTYNDGMRVGAKLFPKSIYEPAIMEFLELKRKRIYDRKKNK